jgi:hypothetical protein
MPRRKLTPSPIKFSIHELSELWRRLVEHADALPMDLLVKLENLIGSHHVQHCWTQEEKEGMRWAMVCELLNQGVGWDIVFEQVSTKLKTLGHPAATGPRGIETGYKSVQRKLQPSGQHRPRTWRRHH